MYQLTDVLTRQPPKGKTPQAHTTHKPQSRTKVHRNIVVVSVCREVGYYVMLIITQNYPEQMKNVYRFLFEG